MILDNQHSLLFFLPELTLTIGMLLVILCDITLKGLRNRLNPILTVLTLVLAAYYYLPVGPDGSREPISRHAGHRRVRPVF